MTIISLDTETTGIDHYHSSKPFFVTVCNEDMGIKYWEWRVDPLTRQPIVPAEDLLEIQAEIAGADEIVMHNAKFDVTALYAIGIDRFPWHKVRDTLLAGHVLHSSMPHDLTSMAATYLNLDIQPLEDRLRDECVKARRVAKKYPAWRIAREGDPDMPSAKEKIWKLDTWLPAALALEQSLPENHSWWTVLSNYANADSPVTIQLWLEMRKLIEDRDLLDIYMERLKVLPVAVRMEGYGITANSTNMSQLYDEYKEQADNDGRLCVNIAKTYGYELTMAKGGANNKSMTGFCFGTREPEYDEDGTPLDSTYLKQWLDLPVVQRSEKTGVPSLDKNVIDEYMVTLPRHGKQFRFINALRNRRKRGTALSYMDAYQRFWLPYGEHNGHVVVEPLNREQGIRRCTNCGRAGTELRTPCPKNVWYVLHPNLNPTGAGTLRWSSNNPNEQNICVDEETEFLTSKGWVRADQLTDEYQVAQYWKETGSIDFVKPLVHRKHFSGDLRHITTEQKIDMMLTPAHRCLLRNRKTYETMDVRADQFRNDYQHLQAGSYEGGSARLTSSQVIWLCAVQADGSYHGTGKYYCGIRFIFKKMRKIRRLRWCLIKLGASYTERRFKTEAGMVTSFYVHASDSLVKWARELMPEKCLGSWLLDYDRETLDLFCKELFLWDGDSTSKRTYTSSVKANVDWAQILFSLSNSRAWTYSKVPSTGWNSKEHHYLNVTRGRDCTMTTNFSLEKVPHDGTVYCVTVPSSYMVIRRNGKVSITGNSKQEGFNLRYCFGPPPGHEWWSLDYQNIELRIPAYEAPEPVMIELFERPDDPPYFGSYHLMNASIIYPDLFWPLAEQKGAFKKKYASTWYQYCKNFGFAVQYGAQPESGTADRAAHKPGAHRMVMDKLKNLSALNARMIRQAIRYGYVETIPDKTVNPRRGYPLMCTRTEWGKILPTVPLSYHVQSTAMWCTAKAMVRCQDKLNRWNKTSGRDDHRLVMQVHDELVFCLPKRVTTVPDPQAEGDYRTVLGNLSKIRELQKLMERSGEDIGVPLTVGVEYHSDNWSVGVSV